MGRKVGWNPRGVADKLLRIPSDHVVKSVTGLPLNTGHRPDMVIRLPLPRDKLIKRLRALAGLGATVASSRDGTEFHVFLKREPS